MGKRVIEVGSARWRRLAASVVGLSHEERDIPCQDFSATSCVATAEGEVLLLAAADGAGSAAHSDMGSRLACETIIRIAGDWFSGGKVVAELEQSVLEDWLLEAIRAISNGAAEREVPVRDLACTLLLAVVGAAHAWFAQIGDGAIVLRDGDAYRVVFWPQSGEYANMTYFLTDAEALTRVQHLSHAGIVDEVGMFTDGVQPVALHYATRSAHEPFFRPMFAALRAQPAGVADALQQPLVSFLRSPKINERTDDDKTLVMATRRAPDTPRARSAAVSAGAGDSVDVEQSEESGS